MVRFAIEVLKSNAFPYYGTPFGAPRATYIVCVNVSILSERVSGSYRCTFQQLLSCLHMTHILARRAGRTKPGSRRK